MEQNTTLQIRSMESVHFLTSVYGVVYIGTCQTSMNKTFLDPLGSGILDFDKKEKKRESSVTNEVFPRYLFRKGERWTHVDKEGNLWYEDIKTK